jgi:hypothetical protein
MTERVNDRQVNIRLRLEPRLAKQMQVMAQAHGISTPKFIVLLLKRLAAKNQEAIDGIQHHLNRLDVE